MKWHDFEKIINLYINRFGKEIENKYIGWKNNPVWKKYYEGNLYKKDIDIVIKFLKEWGRMDRVIGKLKKQMGEGRFIEVNISAGKNCQKYFFMINKYKFTTIDFGNKISSEKEILRLKDINEIIFSEFSNALRWTSPSKIMHMVNPKLFLMWDDKIRTKWGCGYGARAYTNFLIRMQLEYNELIEDFTKIQNIKRDNAESTFAAIKKKFGENIKSRNRIAQENEMLCKIIAYNITVLIHSMFELGITPDFS